MDNKCDYFSTLKNFDNIPQASGNLAASRGPEKMSEDCQPFEISFDIERSL